MWGADGFVECGLFCLCVVFAGVGGKKNTRISWLKIYGYGWKRWMDGRYCTVLLTNQQTSMMSMMSDAVPSGATFRFP